MYAPCLWMDGRSAVQQDGAEREGLNRLLAGQRRRHIVARYMTARRWADAFERAVVSGVSPTGYGPPLTPLAPDVAQGLLEPVAAIIERLRAFAAEQAPAELSAAEAPRSERHTVLWARNLLERLAEAVEGPAHQASARAEVKGLREGAQCLADDVRPLIARARTALAALEDR